MKIFCITKDFLDNEGIKCIVHEKPVALIAGVPSTAKSYKWNTLEEFRSDTFITDTKALGSFLEIMEIDTQQINQMISMFPNEEGADIIEYTNVIEDADVIICRMYRNDTSFLKQEVPMQPSEKLEYNNKSEDKDQVGIK
jgi:DNA-binding transcriptional regulator YbjK